MIPRLFFFQFVFLKGLIRSTLPTMLCVQGLMHEKQTSQEDLSHLVNLLGRSKFQIYSLPTRLLKLDREIPSKERSSTSS